jgi:cellulose synthase/poly-beta-1,6-N-acetylglucosamine synthase-like glycosyltransferase
MSNLMREMLIVIFWCSLAATAYTYFLYPLLLMVFSRMVQWHRKRHIHAAAIPTTNDYMLPGVTMVVSAYNEEAVLSKKIANCREIDYPADKISFLIGSDGSDDRTWDILQQVTDERFRTTHSHQRCGKVQMLNSLMGMANTDIVVFSDANTMFQSGAIRELVKPFRNAKVGCVIGKLELTASADDAQACRPEGLYWRYENRLKQMESVLGAVPTINGGIFAIRRELFEELPGCAVTEDQVLGMKIMSRGFRCVFADKACARETVSSWAGELRRRIRISAGNFQSLMLVPEILNPRCGRVSFAFFSHKLLRWLVPFFLAAMLLSNILMVGEAFYGSTLVLQGLFYASGLIGVIIPKVTGAAKILSIPKYFLAMNLAILVGFARFITHRQQVTWAKAQRGDE